MGVDGLHHTIERGQLQLVFFRLDHGPVNRQAYPVEPQFVEALHLFFIHRLGEVLKLRIHPQEVFPLNGAWPAQGGAFGFGGRAPRQQTDAHCHEQQQGQPNNRFTPHVCVPSRRI